MAPHSEHIGDLGGAEMTTPRRASASRSPTWSMRCRSTPSPSGWGGRRRRSRGSCAAKRVRSPSGVLAVRGAPARDRPPGPGSPRPTCAGRPRASCSSARFATSRPATSALSTMASPRATASSSAASPAAACCCARSGPAMLIAFGLWLHGEESTRDPITPPLVLAVTATAVLAPLSHLAWERRSSGSTGRAVCAGVAGSNPVSPT
jgi:hypothetical protein